MIGDYPILAGPVPIDEATRADLAAVLTDDGTYLDPGMGKLCAFSPGVALRFADKSATVDVLLCFSCEQLKVWKDGTYAGGGYFDHGRDDLAAIVKRLFPEDEALQKL